MGRRRPAKDEDRIDINISPMIDMVFILLIFFIVTTVFVDEDGFTAERPRPNPETTPPDEEPPEPVVIEIRQNGSIFVRDEEIGVRGVRRVVENAIVADDTIPVMVQAHVDAPATYMIQTYDLARAAGATAVSLQALEDD